MRVCNPFSSSFKKRPGVAAGMFIENDVLRCAQIAFDRADGAGTLVRSFELGLPDAETGRTDGRSEWHVLYGRVFETLRKAGVPNEAPIAFALPFPASVIKVIDGQGLTLKEVGSSLRTDFARYFSFAEKDAAYDVAETFLPNGENGYRRAFLLAASKREQIASLTETCKQYGYALEAVEPAQVALERALGILSGKDGATVLTVCFDAKSMFCALSAHRQPFFFHRSEYGPEAREIDVRLRDVLQIALAQYPAMQIQKVCLFGDRLSPEMETPLRRLFQPAVVDIRVLDEWRSFFRTERVAPWLVPYGLAMRGAAS